ncbi:MAG: OmpA family protein [Deltaproteobacteria bacterium]|nr:OmpA family protein [Deltaproteobacteria bacterium]MBW2418676.1 OmpA family protein [Deltaproteobacteria bacterium]
MIKTMPTALNLFLVLGAAVLTFACAGRPLPDQQPFAVPPVSFSADQWREVDNIVIISDASGSQYYNETLRESKALTRSFVGSLPDPSQRARDSRNYNAGLIVFGGDDRVVVPLAGFDRSALNTAAAGIQPLGEIYNRGGTTPLAQVFGEVASSLAGRSGKTAVVLFSDGLADDDDEALDAAQAMLNGYSGPICLHGVQAGNSEEGTRFLRTLSELSSPCGSFNDRNSLASATAVDAYTVGLLAGAAPRPPSTPPVAAATPCEQTVHLRGVRFEFDSDEIQPGTTSGLDRAVSQLNGCPDVQVQLEGYTDSVGPNAYNQGLSERRAGAVKEYLLRNGLGRDRIQSVQGFGSSSPVAPNDTDEGRAQNRRVELEPHGF